MIVIFRTSSVEMFFLFKQIQPVLVATRAGIATTMFLVEIVTECRLSERDVKRAAGYVEEVLLNTTLANTKYDNKESQRMSE